MYNNIATRIVTPRNAPFAFSHTLIFGENAFHGSEFSDCPCRNVTVNHERRFSMAVQITCATCGNVFSVSPSLARNGRKYCSMACRPKTGCDNGNWRGGLVPCTCLVCGKEYSVKQKIIKAGKGKFCSRSCASKHHGQSVPNTRVAKTCVVCGKITLIKKSRVDGQGTYCSYACMATDYQQRQVGLNNPNYKHGNSSRSGTSRLRRQRLKENGGQHNGKDIDFLLRQQQEECAHCQCKLEKYHVDHIIPVSRGGNDFVGNLQLLCPECNLQKLGKLTVEWKYENILKERKKKMYAENRKVKREKQRQTQNP